MLCTCPKCGTSHRLTPAEDMTDAQWIAENAPGTKRSETPKVPCHECWKAAKKAHESARQEIQ